MSTHIIASSVAQLSFIYKTSVVSASFLSPEEAKTLVHSFVTSRVAYTAIAFCMVYLMPHITLLLYCMSYTDWPPLKQSIYFKILLFAFKAIHGIAPSYVQNLVSLKSQGAYNLRSSGGIF